MSNGSRPSREEFRHAIDVVVEYLFPEIGKPHGPTLRLVTGEMAVTAEDDNLKPAEAAPYFGWKLTTLRARQHDPEVAACRIDTQNRKHVYSKQRVLEYRAKH